MPNIFQKPIAAKPLSEFVQLPLQFIGSQMDKQSKRINNAKATMNAIDDTLLKTRALAKDIPRRNELLNGIQAELDSIVEKSGNSYTNVAEDLNTLKRKINKQMLAGELGSINNAYSIAQQDYSKNLTLYRNGKIQKSGLERVVANMNAYQTTQNKDTGSWGTFNSYIPSNISDPEDEINKHIKQIHAQYDGAGNPYISSDVITRNIYSQLKNNGGLRQSMKENFMAIRGIDKTPKNYAQYENNFVKRLVGDAQYNKRVGSVGLSLNAGPTPLDVSGSSNVRGTTAGAMRRFFGVGLGEFEKYATSKKGIRAIKFIYAKTGVKPPSESGQLMKYVEDAMAHQSNRDVITEAYSSVDLSRVLTKDGRLIQNGAVRRISTGEILSKSERASIFRADPKDKSRKPVLMGSASGNARPYGEYVLKGTDGSYYVQENRSVTHTKKYVYSLINQAVNAWNGEKEITLPNTVLNKNTGKLIFNKGTYTAMYNPEDKVTRLTQNGILKYIVYFKDGKQFVKYY